MRVEWKATALDRLADVFVAADPAARDEIERAVERINAELADDPERLGESRASETRRVWFYFPLMVMFEVRRSEGLVLVTHTSGLKHR